MGKGVAGGGTGFLVEAWGMAGECRWKRRCAWVFFKGRYLILGFCYGIDWVCYQMNKKLC